MKLQRLSIRNFLRIAELEVELGDSSAFLFCGPNEAGKSTVAESIRFAMLGDTPRVMLKKNYDRLVHQGGKKGTVSLAFDDVVIQRDVGSGTPKEKFALTPEQEVCARIAFGAQSFVSMKPDERRSLLFKLAEVKITADEIVKRMTETFDVPAELTKRYKPLLSSGMETALKAAQADATDLRAKWKEITGEVYGSEKAKTWKPEFAPGPKRPIRTSAEDLAKISKVIGEHQQKADAIGELIGAEAANARRREEIQAEMGRVREAAASITETRARYATLEARMKVLQDELATNIELESRMLSAGALLSCPSCDSRLALSKDTGELEFVDPETLNFAGDPDQLAALRGTVATGRKNLETLSREYADLSVKVAAGESATQRLQDLQQKHDALKNPRFTGDQLAQERDAARAAVNQAKLNLQAAEADNATLDRMERSEKAAQETYLKLVSTELAVDALAPSGIRSDLLAEALEPINQRMLASAHLAGWQAPSIDEDMDIVREDGLTYELLSESAQWRLSAIVADAIASMSGVRVLILDRMDVLDLPGRAQLLKWVSHLATDSFDTVLVMATLKEPPKGLPPSIKPIWMGEAVT